MTHALINPNNLKSARERAGLTASEVAQKLHQAETKILEWEQGIKPITFTQAQEFAKAVYIPFGYLYLDNMPEQEDLTLTDFRTIGDHIHSKQPSLALRQIIDIVKFRVEWMHDYLVSQNAEPNEYVGRAVKNNLNDSQIITDIRETLQLDALNKTGNWEMHNRELVKRIENLGIMVMRSGNASNGHSESTKLEVTEFRGFVISDEYAPAIFINSNDARQAQNFTLLHELAHIWLGQSGISDSAPHSNNSEEKRCNKIAAECLVPTEKFKSKWNKERDIKELAPELAKEFKVSDWVIIRRAYDLDYISQKIFNEYLEGIRRRNAQIRDQQKTSHEQGPNWFVLHKIRIGSFFAKTVIHEALNGAIPLTEAHRLTGIKPNKLREFLEQ